MGAGQGNDLVVLKEGREGIRNLMEKTTEAERVGNQKAPRVLFLTRSLGRGGAERQLVALANELQGSGWEIAVACFYTGGAFQADLERSGVRVIDLKKRGRWDLPGFLWRLLRVFRQYDPDVVHGSLPVANMLALLARVMRRDVFVVWGVRASNVDLSSYDWLSRLTFWASCRLARYADRIIANSQAGADYHVACGYSAGRIAVVPNGVDTERFRFDAEGRGRLRREWRVSDYATLVGLVGRLDPMKDHATFLAAAARLAARDPYWHFVCVGDGCAEYLARLYKLTDASGLAGRLTWVGARDDMRSVYSALDIAVSSSSFGEGFPNVVAEAMACERPCVVTDVGDSALIVGKCGLVVPPRNPAALAAAIQQLTEASEGAGISLGVLGRERITHQFNLEQLSSRSKALLWELFEPRRPVSGGRGIREKLRK